MIIQQIPTASPRQFSLQGWENVLFELGSERVKAEIVLVSLIENSIGNLRDQNKRGDLQL